MAGRLAALEGLCGALGGRSELAACLRRNLSRKVNLWSQGEEVTGRTTPVSTAAASSPMSRLTPAGAPKPQGPCLCKHRRNRSLRRQHRRHRRKPPLANTRPKAQQSRPTLPSTHLLLLDALAQHEARKAADLDVLANARNLLLDVLLWRGRGGGQELGRRSVT